MTEGVLVNFFQRAMNPNLLNCSFGVIQLLEHALLVMIRRKHFASTLHQRFSIEAYPTRDQASFEGRNLRHHRRT